MAPEARGVKPEEANVPLMTSDEAKRLEEGEEVDIALIKERNHDQFRAMTFIEGLKDQDDSSPFKRGLACFLKYGVQPLLCILAIYVCIGKALYKVYKVLPMNVLTMLFGLGLCFYGGHYLMVIAAIEAFRNMGGQQFMDDMVVVWEQGSLVAIASAEDDKKDDDKNGIADVKEISSKDLLNRKAKMAMRTVTEPQRLQVAVVHLYAAYLCVLATLKLQFARTVAIALGLAEMLELPLTRCIGPTLAYVMGDELNHWVYTIISTIVKIIAVAFAWYLQTIISAFYSALRGGRLFANALFAFLSDSGCLQKMPDCLVKKPFNPDESYLDECVQYPLAAAGFYVQWTYGFTLPFPQNLVLFPLTCVEWILRWQVTFS